MIICKCCCLSSAYYSDSCTCILTSILKCVLNRASCDMYYFVGLNKICTLEFLCLNKSYLNNIHTVTVMQKVHFTVFKLFGDKPFHHNSDLWFYLSNIYTPLPLLLTHKAYWFIGANLLSLQWIKWSLFRTLKLALYPENVV